MKILTGKFSTVAHKLSRINWGVIFLLFLLTSIGCAVLYSAASGQIWPWAYKQTYRFGIALTNLRFWLKYAYILYSLSFLLLIFVEAIGSSVMGAQRWLDLYVINLQPSELMKISLILALARYYHYLSFEDAQKLRLLLFPLILICLPALLVLRQPDLGTAVILVLAGAAMIFISGIRKRFIVTAILGTAVSLPIIWSILREYQKERILTFLSPERDPLGTGYHIMQSKIALGSGGFFGKGFLNGTQGYLNFLPEKQTDFIFTMFCEEFGMIGGVFLLGLYIILLTYCFSVIWYCRSHFGRMLGMGMTVILFLYIFINIGMVMGLLPVVGIPLPLISYGGTSMLTTLICIGFIMSISIHWDMRIYKFKI
jgi:rod shape determining protein RodA